MNARASLLLAGGALRTGDKGCIGAEGHLALTGRFKELINRGGEKLSPFEVEEPLRRHPAVLDLIAFAAPHCLLGEVAGVAVIVRPHHAPPTLRELRVCASATLSASWLPEVVVFVSRIPAGPTGKPMRIGLAKRLELPVLHDGTPDTWECLAGGEQSDAPPRVAPVQPVSEERIAPAPTVSLDEVLGMARAAGSIDISADAPLMEAGLSSMGVIRLREALQRTQPSGVALSSTLVFEHPTARLLAAALADDAGSAPALPTLTRAAGGAEPGRNARHVDVLSTSARLPSGVFGQLWSALASATDLVGEVPSERWREPGPSQPLLARRLRHGGFVRDAQLFDAGAFGISPAEAIGMDPQQRLLLEHAYASLRAGGRERRTLHESVTAVCLGMTNADFMLLVATARVPASAYAVTGATLSIAAGRVSYALGLHGPCATYDTSCSSALTAAHAATRLLQRDECSASVLAAVSLALSPASSAGLAVAGMTSALGRCHTFDARADGYARAEACGALSLESSRATHKAAAGAATAVAVVTALHLDGAAVRHDGRSASLTAPNGTAQRGVVAAALVDAAVGAGELEQMEAHGTGTALGDPVEAASIVAVTRAAQRLLSIGGAKASCGHAEPAAGLAGLLKLATVVRHGAAAANAQLRALNPNLGGVLGGRHALHAQLACTRATASRWSGVSSFGYSGTIAHAVLFGSAMMETKRFAGFACMLKRRAFLWVRRAFAQVIISDADASRASRSAQARIDRMVQRQTLPPRSCTNTVIIGAGLCGLTVAATFSAADAAVTLLEKSRAFGGVWYHFANATSRVNSSEPSYRLPLRAPSANTNHSPRHQILNDALRTVHEHHLRKRMHFKTEARRAFTDATIQGSRVTGIVTARHHPFEITCQMVAICTNRRLGTPREVYFVGERTDYLGQVRRGLARDASGLAWRGQHVLIIGMGAFAVENMRTALEHGAVAVSFVCRRRGTVCPQIVDWVNFIRPFDDALQQSKEGDAAILRSWQGVYRAAGAHSPECWAKGVLKADGHTISVSDLFFIAHRTGLVTSQLDEVQRFTSSGVRTMKDHQMDATVVIKCVGFDANASNERLVGRSHMRAPGLVHRDMWLLGEPHFDKEALASPFGSSGLNAYSYSAKLMVRYWRDQPQVAGQLAESSASLMRINHFSASDVQEGSLAAQQADPESIGVLRAHLSMVAARFEAVMPLSEYIVTNSQQWETLLDKCSAYRQDRVQWAYPFTHDLRALATEGLHIGNPRDMATCASNIAQAASPSRLLKLDEVLELVQAALPVDAALDADTLLAEVGLDSLATVGLLDSLRNATGDAFELPASMFLGAATVRTVAHAISARASNEESLSAPGGSESDNSSNLVSARRQPNSWLLDPGVVTLSSGDESLAPLIVLPSVFGTVTHWRPLALKLLPCVWGVEHEYLRTGKDSYLHRPSLLDDATAFAALLVHVFQQTVSSPPFAHFIGASIGATLAHMTASAIIASGGQALAVILVDPPPPGPARLLSIPYASDLDQFKASAVEAVRQAQQLAGLEVDREVIATRLAGCSCTFEVALVATEELSRLGQATLDYESVRMFVLRLHLYVRNLRLWALLPQLPMPLSRDIASLHIAMCTRRNEFYELFFEADDVQAFSLYGGHEMLPAIEGDHLSFVNRVCTGREPVVTDSIASILEESASRVLQV